MDRNEFNGIMRLLNDIWGGYSPSSYDTWFMILEKRSADKIRDVIWSLSETAKVKPRIADLIEALGHDVINGGSQVTENNGCTVCSGGWVMVEVEPGVMAGMRCMCDLGDKLNPKSSRITAEMIKYRRWNIKGQLIYPNSDEMKREERLMKMNHEDLIAWCKRGMDRMKGIG